MEQSLKSSWICSREHKGPHDRLSVVSGHVETVVLMSRVEGK